MTSFTLNLISVKVSFHDIFKKTLNITPVNITSFTVTKEQYMYLASERSERDTLRSVQLKIGDILWYMQFHFIARACHTRFTAAVKIPLPLATFQF